MKHYVVRHHPSYSRTWQPVSHFETAQEALAEYEGQLRAFPRERVQVVDLRNGTVLADSRIK
ncbi:MAG: hypothetical protein OYM47_02765 [Gemmatimonadota bacterium]|nr:hypothetical protein [Gemmatimonadota bacterium]